MSGLLSNHFLRELTSLTSNHNPGRLNRPRHQRPSRELLHRDDLNSGSDSSINHPSVNSNNSADFASLNADSSGDIACVYSDCRADSASVYPNRDHDHIFAGADADCYSDGYRDE